MFFFVGIIWYLVIVGVLSLDQFEYSYIERETNLIENESLFKNYYENRKIQPWTMFVVLNMMTKKNPQMFKSTLKSTPAFEEEEKWKKKRKMPFPKWAAVYGNFYAYSGP